MYDYIASFDVKNAINNIGESIILQYQKNQLLLSNYTIRELRTENRKKSETKQI